MVSCFLEVTGSLYSLWRKRLSNSYILITIVGSLVLPSEKCIFRGHNRQPQYFSKTKQYEKPDEFLSELRLGEFTAQDYGAGSNGLPTRAAACVPSKDTQARGSDHEHVELMLTHLF